MKTLKIYNLIATILIVALSIFLYSVNKQLQETEEVLKQCSDRYYQEITK